MRFRRFEMVFLGGFEGFWWTYWWTFLVDF
nr:MAG TPA: hypothetical protein [Caudoviricetes sp.]